MAYYVSEIGRGGIQNVLCTIFSFVFFVILLLVFPFATKGHPVNSRFPRKANLRSVCTKQRCIT
jgi:hypothetical protein